jgi:regulator of sirC expression with transglutaminase-like and TPR domain
LIDGGNTLAKAGHDREAIADFSHALDIDGNAIVAFRERGLIYEKLGDFAAALADLTWFTRFEPTRNRGDAGGGIAP